MEYTNEAVMIFLLSHEQSSLSYLLRSDELYQAFEVFFSAALLINNYIMSSRFGRNNIAIFYISHY